MPDREKVIEGLEKVWDAFNHMEHELYVDYVFDALTLLKEREAVEPEEIVNERFPVGDYRRTIGWLCGKCGKTLMGDGNYCSYCGQAVKWDA